MSSIRLLRGQIVVREHLNADTEQFTHLIIPGVSTAHDKDAQARSRTWHRGEVLAKGPPALHGVHEVPHGFEVGDTVLFHFGHNEKAFTRPWTDGEPAVWLPQQAISAVLET